jgi:UTP:GlnB (protein PII) uridylyltransferase
MLDNEASTEATVVEASGRDRPGLLHHLARAISEQGLSIISAHIDSYGERAVDAFYVQTAAGQDCGLRLGAALEQAAVDEQAIGAFAGCHGHELAM